MLSAVSHFIARVSVLAMVSAFDGLRPVSVVKSNFLTSSEGRNLEEAEVTYSFEHTHLLCAFMTLIHNAGTEIHK
jgi:hypothetical protein